MTEAQERLQPIPGVAGKVCPRCREWWPREQAFYARKVRRDRIGWQSWCRACIIEMQRAQNYGHGREQMEAWRYVWRNGIAPTFSNDELNALLVGLELDDPALVQGACVVRDGDYECASCRVVGGCAIGYAVWNHGAVPFEDEVLEAFAATLNAADYAIGCDLGAAPFLNWFDDTPREEMRRELLAEVKRSLALRTVQRDGAPT